MNNSMNISPYESNKSSTNKFKISVHISKDKSLNGIEKGLRLNLFLQINKKKFSKKSRNSKSTKDSIGNKRKRIKFIPRLNLFGEHFLVPPKKLKFTAKHLNPGIKLHLQITRIYV